MNFITPKTESIPEIVWNELGAFLGRDYKENLTVMIVYGVDSTGVRYIGTGHFINNELNDVYEIEKRNVSLFKDDNSYWLDVRTQNSIIEQRAINQNCDRVTGKIIKP